MYNLTIGHCTVALKSNFADLKPDFLWHIPRIYFPIFAKCKPLTKITNRISIKQLFWATPHKAILQSCTNLRVLDSTLDYHEPWPLLLQMRQLKASWWHTGDFWWKSANILHLSMCCIIKWADPREPLYILVASVHFTQLTWFPLCVMYIMWSHFFSYR